ncbi:chromosome partitioning protein [Tumebacillus sp. BK434]|uniref:ParA family protein n=1 Tax=Tumebacillus sp. BK434 TaxID=2512169 RepID=UPI001043403C|nr:AAA family ATPase [Tumebacillus sp. BK434]TCP50997.1 chromosome partitioning protein [Tumebacillus sp. BK434]
MSAIITSIINWKGGVGKTTLAHHLGTGLTYRRKRTLLVDLDPQCNLSYLSVGAANHLQLVRQGTPTIHTVFDSFFKHQASSPQDIILKQMVTSSKDHVFNHADLILSHQDLTMYDIKLSAHKSAAPDSFEEHSQLQLEKVAILKNFLRQIRDRYDYIFIDCPASLHLITQNAIFASDYYIVPTKPDHLSTIGLSGIRKIIDKFNRQFASLCAYENPPASYTPAQLAGVVFNMVHENHKGLPKSAHQHYINQMRNQDHSSVFDQYMIECDDISEAALKHQPIYPLSKQRNAPKKTVKQVEYLHHILTEFMIRVREEVPV